MARYRKNCLSGGTGKMKKILILQLKLDQSLAIAKYLKAYSDEYFVVGGLSEHERAFRSSHYDGLRRFNIHGADNDSFDLILPTAAKSTYDYFSSVNSLKVGNVTYDRGNLVVFDKLKMLDIVKSLGLPIPGAYANIAEVDNYPVFYKELYENGKGARGVAKEKKDLDAVMNNGRVFFQEYIDSPYTFGVAFLAKGGAMVTHFTQKEVASIPRAGGTGVILERFNDERLIEYTSRILKKLKYNGWGLAEFKYCDKRKDYVFMEVNAKMWASIEFALLNNNVFLKELFGIDYPNRDIGKIVYTDRLARYGFIDLMRYAYKYREYHFIHNDPLSIMGDYAKYYYWYIFKR